MTRESKSLLWILIIFVFIPSSLPLPPLSRSGVYTVRGVTYLEGQYHEERLLSGTKCEIFVEVSHLSRLSSLSELSFVRKLMIGALVKLFVVRITPSHTQRLFNELMMSNMSSEKRIMTPKQLRLLSKRLKSLESRAIGFV